MSEFDLAGLMYMTFNADGYGRSWKTTPHKTQWMAVAAAVIRAREAGRL